MTTKKGNAKKIIKPVKKAPVKVIRDLLPKETTITTTVQDINLEDIIPDPNQPRQHYTEDEVVEMALSVLNHGVLQPVTLRPYTGLHSKYMIVFGERRYRASLVVQEQWDKTVTTIPAIIKDITDEEALEIQIIENLQRKDMHPMDEGESYNKFLIQINKRKGIDAIKEMSLRIGKSPKYIRSRIALTQMITPFKLMFLKNRMTFHQAIQLSRTPTDIQQSIFNVQHVKNWEENENYYLPNIDHLINKESRSLNTCGFDLDDTSLNPEMGACATCRYNSKNSIELFAESNIHLCRNVACFTIKQNNLLKNKMAQAADEEVMFVSNRYYGNDPEREELAKEVGVKQIIRSEDFEKVDEYTPANAIKQAQEEGRLKRAFVVTSNDPDEIGEIVDIIISNDITQPEEDEDDTDNAQQIIDTLKRQEQQAEEKDFDVLANQMRSFFRNKDRYPFNDDELSDIESRAFAYCIYNSLAFQDKERFRKVFNTTDDMMVATKIFSTPKLNMQLLYRLFIQSHILNNSNYNPELSPVFFSLKNLLETLFKDDMELMAEAHQNAIQARKQKLEEEISKIQSPVTAE